MTFHSVGNFIIPTDELHHFSEGLVNHQPEDQCCLKSSGFSMGFFYGCLGDFHGFNMFLWGFLGRFLAPAFVIGSVPNDQRCVILVNPDFPRCVLYFNVHLSWCVIRCDKPCNYLL